MLRSGARIQTAMKLKKTITIEVDEKLDSVFRVMVNMCISDRETFSIFKEALDEEDLWLPYMKWITTMTDESLNLRKAGIWKKDENQDNPEDEFERVGFDHAAIKKARKLLEDNE